MNRVHPRGSSLAASPGARLPARAQRVMEGESKAREFIARLQAQQADPGELALIVAALYGTALRGFCAAITKSLRGGAA